MTIVPLRIQIPYREYVKPFRCRSLRPTTFLKSKDIGIKEIAPQDAPTVHRVRTFSPLDTVHDNTYSIRYFNDRLWWPALWEGRIITRSEFIRSAEGASSHALVALDPSIGLRMQQLPVEDPSIDPNKIQKRESSTLADREIAAELGTERIIYCGDEVLLDAGDPIIYAVDRREGIELIVGTGDWSRVTTVQVLPGPGSWPATLAARAGRAFAIEDRNARERVLCDQGCGVYGHFEIESALPSQGAASSALLCAYAIVDAALEAAREGNCDEAMRTSLSSLFYAGKARLFLDDVDIYAALTELSDVEDPWLLNSLPFERRHANEVLARLLTTNGSGLRALDEGVMFLLSDQPNKCDDPRDHRSA